MPELPELEVIKTRLAAEICGRGAALLALVAITATMSCQRAPARADDGSRFVIKVLARDLLCARQRYGFIDRTGHIVIPLKFDYAERFSEGLALAYQSKRKGYINRQGEFVIVAGSWTPHGDFHEGLASFGMQGGGAGFIDTAGKVIVEPRFDGAYRFSEGLANVLTHVKLTTPEGKQSVARLEGYINREGDLAVAPRFVDVSIFSEGLACVGLNGKFGFIDTTGQLVIKPEYDHCGDFSDGLAVVRVEDSCFAIDRAGRPVFTRRFDILRPFLEGLAAARQDGRWGYIDTLGEWVIPPRYDRAYGFSEGVAMVEDRSQAGYINRSGEFVIHLPAGWAGCDFEDSLAFVTDYSRSAGYVDHSGRFVWKTRNTFFTCGGARD